MHACIYFLLVTYIAVCLLYLQGLLPDVEVQRELIKMNKQLLKSIPILNGIFFIDEHQQSGMYMHIKRKCTLYKLYSVNAE